MAWSWYSGIQKRCYAYLVERYLGRFFDEKLDPKQLTVDLYNGKYTLKDIRLDVQAVNKVLDEQNSPLELVDGSIGKIFVLLPWNSLLYQSSTIEISSLRLTFQPKHRNESATSMFESVWTSMSSSLHLAEECIKQEIVLTPNDPQPCEGLQSCAEIIDSILRRIKVKFLDTIVQLEYLPKGSAKGVGIVIHADLISYSDESVNDPTKEEATDLTRQDDKKAYMEQSYSAKSVRCEGVSISTVEFSYKARVISQSTIATAFTEDFDRYSSNSERSIILFCKIQGKLEVTVRMKSTEDLEGPKFAIKVDVGSLLLFFSPRQLHLLMEFVEGLLNPDVEDTTLERYVGKPMTQEDYEKIEKDIQQQILLAPMPNCLEQKTGRGWATGAFDEHEMDENFSPLRNRSGLYESAMSAASTMESSMSSSVTSSCTEATSRTHRRMYKIDADPTADIIRFDVHLISFYVVLLHEDLLVESSSTKSALNSASVKQMELVVQNFFTSTSAILEAKDFKEANNAISEACEINHLRLLASNLHLEGDQKKTRSAIAVNGNLEVTRLELKEYLFDNDEKSCQQVPLITFNEQQYGAYSTAKSSLNMNFKHIEKTARTDLSKSGPKTEITFSLNKCTVQADITIIDRIASLLNPQPICDVNKPNNVWGRGPPPETVKLDSVVDIKVVCPLMLLKIRFPKLDFRPPHINKTSWWQRNIRPDYLTLELDAANMHTIFKSKQISQDFELTATRISVSYSENANMTPIKIARAGQEEAHCSSFQEAIGDCKLTIKLMTKKNVLSERTVEVPLPPSTSTSTEEILEQHYKTDKGPFSAKQCVHQSDTPHNQSQQEKSTELYVPGEKREINAFIETSLSTSRLQIDINLPTLSMQLISKHLYELIYNRINNDLLLWEPRAVHTNSSNYDKFVPSSFGQMECDEVFTLCKTKISHGSESDDEENEEDGSTIFHSTYAPPSKVCETNQTDTFLTVNLQIGNGVLCMFVPVRDATTNNVIPGQQGEFLIKVSDANVFVVNGYNGDPSLGYVCLQIHNAELFHCDMMSAPSQSPPLRGLDVIPGPHLSSTIYRSEPGVLEVNRDRGGEREMITLCVKIQASHETHHAKNITLAVGFDKVTLRHKMCTSPNNWTSQLVDFFNVQDYPIPGYQTKEILTELFCHFWDSAIDYRPRYLPLRSLLSIGSFSISSHLSPEIDTSTLRFIVEDCGLFLSQKGVPKTKLPYSGPVDLKRDYVNVMELGVFEISFKATDQINTKVPNTDMRASNDVIRIRTCWDSARALTQLLKYFVSDGDLTTLEDLPGGANSSYSSPRHQPHEELVSLTSQEVTNVSESQQQQIHDLLLDAMDDVEPPPARPKPKSDFYSYNGAKVFYFPGENQDAGQTFSQVATDLGDVSCKPLEDEEIDDEYCFIDKELGFNVFRNGAEPEIKWVCDEPVRIIENHFTVPNEKVDPLKTPKHFPIPVLVYTLCEMTIIWTKYGGNDFGAKGTVKKNVNFSATDGNVSFSNSAKELEALEEREKLEKDTRGWIIIGGPNRELNNFMVTQLNKIRYRHEVYPETSDKASRQVLLISDFEIKDRILMSSYDKFLYLHTSTDIPKRSNADMLAIKVLHVRSDPQLRTQETGLKVSLLPLRFNIDQDSLQFLVEFFNEVIAERQDDDVPLLSSKNSTPVHQPPIMTVSFDEDNEKSTEQAKKIVDENLLILLEDKNEPNSKKEAPKRSYSTSEDSPIFFRKVLFSPGVFVRLDYRGKHFDLSRGSFWHALLMGLTQLNCSEFHLKRIEHEHGLLGSDKVVAYFLREWINDMKKNQIPSLLSGVGPVYSLVQLFHGIRDLFYLPFEQYQKDGRFFRGLHRGANSFTSSTALAALELTTRLIYLIQITAETAFDMLTPGPSMSYNPKTQKRRKRYSQPKDIREGVTNAYRVVKEGFGETADNIVQVATHEHEQKGYSGAVGGVMRQIPQTLIRPLIIASEATNNVLDGIRCQYVPDARKEADEKWRSDPN